MTDDSIRAFMARDADMSFDERRRLSLQIAEEALARGEEIDRYRRRFCGYHDPRGIEAGVCLLCAAEKEHQRLQRYLDEANLTIRNYVEACDAKAPSHPSARPDQPKPGPLPQPDHAEEMRTTRPIWPPRL